MGKRGAGEGTIFQRKDGLWSAAVTLPDGKRRTMYAKTRRDVAAKLAAVQAQLRAALPVSSEDVTVQDYLRRWLAERVAPRVRPRTYTSYHGQVERNIIPIIGGIRLAALAPADVDRMMAHWLAQGLDADTVIITRGVLINALNVAIQTELLTRNVAKLARPPRATPHRVRAMHPADATAIAAAVVGTRAEGIVALALYAGLRQGEVMGLRWEDVDLERGCIHVRHQLQLVASEWVLTKPKSAAGERTIPLPPQAIAALMAQRARQDERRAELGDAWPGNDLVFTTPDGLPIPGRDARRWLHRALDAAGLPRLRFHDLRHAYATLLIGVGAHPRVVMELMGHSTITVTMNIYGHVTDDVARSAVAGLATALGTATVQRPSDGDDASGAGASETG